MRGKSGIQALVETSRNQNFPGQLFNSSRSSVQVPALPEPTESLVSPRSESGVEVSVSVSMAEDEVVPDDQNPAVQNPSVSAQAAQNQEDCIKYCCPYGGAIAASAVGLGLGALILDLTLQGRIHEATNLGDSPLILAFFAACAGAILGSVASTAHYFNRR